MSTQRLFDPGGRPWWVATALVVGSLAKLMVFEASLDTAAVPTERAATFATLSLFAVGLAPVSVAGWRTRFLALVLLDIAVTSLVFADALHFRYLGDLTSVTQLVHAWQLLHVESSVAALVRPMDLLLLLDLAFVAAAWIVLRGRLWAAGAEARGGRRPMFALLALSAVLAWQPVRLIARDPDGAFHYATTRREIAVSIGLLGYHAYDLVTFAAYPLAGRLGAREDLASLGDAVLQRRAQQARSDLFGIARGRNLVIVMAESLQRWPLELEVNGQPAMPRLRAFARESLDFTAFFDQTHDGTTADGELVSLHSLHPLASGVVATRYGANRFHGLPAILHEAGYTTISAVAEAPAFWNKRQVHPRLGFVKSRFADAFAPGESFGLGLSDGDFFRQAAGFIAGEPRPVMAFLSTLSNHHPYELPAHHRGLRLGKLEDTLVGRYLQSVHYFDAAFGQFIDELRRLDVLDHSVVAVYGDHQAFWEPVPELAEVMGVPDSSRARWEARERLPFLVRLPRGERAGAHAASGGHLDVAPTLLALLGLDPAHEVLLGRDLTSAGESFVVLRTGDFIAGSCACVRETADEGGPCHALGSAQASPCHPLEQGRQRARAELALSDAIVQGDLVGELRSRARAELSPTPPAESHAAGLLEREHLSVIAHRGDSGALPENTLVAIKSAFAAGADLVEVDVRATRDGVLVLLHDERVDRTTDGTGFVDGLTLRELRLLDAGAWKHPSFAGARIPTLAEALLAARGKGALLLDVPVPGLGGVIAATLRLVDAASYVVLGSWDEAQREDFAARLPGVPVLLSEGIPQGWAKSGFIEHQRALGVRGFEIANWSAELIAAAGRYDMPVWVYTVNDEPTMRALIAAGARGIETDVPRLAIDLGRALGVRP